MSEYYILYEIEGFDGTFKAGPYSGEHEIHCQMDDIEGYEGVVNVRLIRVEDWEK